MIYICHREKSFSAESDEVFPEYIMRVGLGEGVYSRLRMGMLVRKWGAGTFIGAGTGLVRRALRRGDASRFLREFAAQCAECILRKDGIPVEGARIGIFARRDSRELSAAADRLAGAGADIVPVLPEISFTLRLLRQRYGMAASGRLCGAQMKKCDLVICFSDAGGVWRELRVFDGEVNVTVAVERGGRECLMPGAAAMELVRMGAANRGNVRVESVDI